MDVLRGVALSGILVVNAIAVLRMDSGIVGGKVPIAYSVVEQVFHQRFFPIFSTLFGLSFGLMWVTAKERAVSPRIVLGRRLVALAMIGAAHQVLQPGEALLPYAFAGLVVPLPATWLPRRFAVTTTGVAGAVLTVAAAGMGGLALIPGLFLLGFSAACADLPHRLPQHRRVLAAATLACAVAAVPVAILQQGDPVNAGYSPASSVAGLLLAGAYIGAVLLAMTTPLRAPLVAFFAPLGRMSLTNYLAATLILTTLRLLDWPIHASADDNANWPALFAVCAAIIVAQRFVSAWWLDRFGQGPLERLWRVATWHRARLKAEDAPSDALTPFPEGSER